MSEKKTETKTSEKKTRIPSWCKFCIAPMILVLLCTFAFIPMGTADMNGDGTEEAYTIFDQLGLGDFAPPTPEERAAKLEQMQKDTEARRNAENDEYLRIVAGDDYENLPDWVLTPSDYFVYARDKAYNDFFGTGNEDSTTSNSDVESDATDSSATTDSPTNDTSDAKSDEWTYESAIKGLLEDDFVKSVFSYTGD